MDKHQIVFEARVGKDVYSEQVDVAHEEAYHFKKLCKERKKKNLLPISFEHWTRPLTISSLQDMNVFRSNHCIVHLYYSISLKKEFKEILARNKMTTEYALSIKNITCP